MEFNEIMKKFREGKLTMDEANEELKKIGADVYFDGNKKVVFGDLSKGVANYTGDALLDNGIGKKDIIKVKDGKIVNEGATKEDLVVIRDKIFHIKADNKTLY